MTLRTLLYPFGLRWLVVASMAAILSAPAIASAQAPHGAPDFLRTTIV